MGCGQSKIFEEITDILAAFADKIEKLEADVKKLTNTLVSDKTVAKANERQTRFTEIPDDEL